MIVETIDRINEHLFVAGKIDLSMLSVFSAEFHEMRINTTITGGFNGDRLTLFVEVVSFVDVSAFEREKKTDSYLNVILAV